MTFFPASPRIVVREIQAPNHAPSERLFVSTPVSISVVSTPYLFASVPRFVAKIRRSA